MRKILEPVGGRMNAIMVNYWDGKYWENIFTSPYQVEKAYFQRVDVMIRQEQTAWEKGFAAGYAAGLAGKPSRPGKFDPWSYASGYIEGKDARTKELVEKQSKALASDC